MRKIVAGLFITLDGVVESPNKWGFRYLNAEMSEQMVAGIAQADAVLLGRNTYDVEDTDEVLNHVIDRVLAFQLEGIPVHVVPVRPSERVLAMRQAERAHAARHPEAQS